MDQPSFEHLIDLSSSGRIEDSIRESEVLLTQTADDDEKASGSLLRSRGVGRQAIDFVAACQQGAVLPTWGTTELIEAEFFGEPLLH
jgi:hypothetical protein